MGIKQRCFLVALLVVCQVACLGFGAAWATGWLWNAFSQVVHSHVLAEGSALAQDLSARVRTMRLDSVEPGSEDWQRLQTLCEEANIPHEGFACVMRFDNGAMLCHPELANDPGLLRLFPGRSLVINEKLTGSITSVMQQAVEQGQNVVAGRVALDGPLYEFTALSLPGQNAILAVYQSDYAIDHFVQSTLRPVMQVGYVLAIFIVGATAIITGFLINRYETGIREAKHQSEEEVKQYTLSLIQSRNAVVFGLAKLAESRDRDTAMHLERLRSYVTLLATELAKTHMEIDHRYVANLAVAAALHDIGKVGIPDAVLLKPGKLTPTERRAMQLHTLLGGECLAAIQQQLGEDDFLELAQQVAVAHHEHWDGGGYPHQLQGKSIPLAARIVALADVYDALTSVRPYKGPYAHVQTRDWIVAHYGTQFDPEVVEAFIACEQDFARINESCSENKQRSGGNAPAEEVITEAVKETDLLPS